MALDWSLKLEFMASSMRCDGVAHLDYGGARSAGLFWAFLLHVTAKQDTVILGFLVNSETGHSEDREPNLRHALGSVKRVKVRATGDFGN